MDTSDSDAPHPQNAPLFTHTTNPSHSVVERNSTSGKSEDWTLFGRKTQQSKVVYFTQVIVLYILILTSLVNITLESTNLNLWCTLLASAIGYLLPSPQLKTKRVV